MNCSEDVEKQVFAENLRKHRNLTFPGWGGLGRFAKAVGVQPDALSRWMNGRQMPSMARIRVIAGVLGVEVPDLLRRQTPESGAKKGVPEAVQAQVNAIDALILFLRYNRQALLGETDSARHEQGIGIIKELLKNEVDGR